MTSQIDSTQPVYGTPTTQSVRTNFATAKQEISNLQDATTGGPFLPLSGGLVSGSLMVQNDPASAREVATKNYVDTHTGAGGGTITGVTAGSGLAGGGTTGTVTISVATPYLAISGGTVTGNLTVGGATALAAATATTPATADNSTALATTAYVKAQGYGAGSVTSITAGAGLTGGTIASSGTIALSTPVSVSNGGTGASTLTANAVLKGNGASAIAVSTITDAGSGITIGSPAGGAAGAGSLALPGPMRVNANAAALPAAAAGTQLRTGGLDGANAAVEIDTFGAGTQPQLNFVGTGGTAAARTAIPNTSFTGVIQFQGYDGSTVATGAQIYGTPVNTWSTSDHGTGLTFSTVAAGGTATATRMSIGRGVGIGNYSGDPGQGGLVLNANAAALPAPPAGTQLHIGNVDGGGSSVCMTSAGSTGGTVYGRGSQGTLAAPAAVGSGQTLLYMQAQGHNGSSYIQGAAILANATATWTGAATPTQWIFYATAPGATGVAQIMALQAGAYVGAPTGLDKGAGSLNAGALYVNGAAVSVSDARLKEKITPSTTDALAALRAIPLYDFDWKSTGPDDKSPRHHSVGFVAQEIENEELIVRGPTEDDPTSIDTLHVLAHLVRAVQQLTERLERLEKTDG